MQLDKSRGQYSVKITKYELEGSFEIAAQLSYLTDGEMRFSEEQGTCSRSKGKAKFVPDRLHIGFITSRESLKDS